MVGLIQNLPCLERLSLHPAPDANCARFELLESTYSRICDTYRDRNQQLVIRNFDIMDEHQKKLNRKEPFAGDDRQNFVKLDFIDDKDCVSYV